MTTSGSETGDSRSIQRGPAVWLATGLGLGLSPFAPGTVGSLWGLPLSWALATWCPVWVQLTVTAVLIALGVPLCTRAAQQLGGKKDPGAIVWDEIASFPLVFVGHGSLSPATLALGFLLHRLFDVTKPPPARQLERLPTGLGIMADDVAAALYANAALWAIGWLTS